MCKKIHRGGNAEQYNADKKYKEAVAIAVEACAADTTKGAEHPRTLNAAQNLMATLMRSGNVREAGDFFRDHDFVATSKRVLGAEHPMTLRFRWCCFDVILYDEDSSVDELAGCVEGLDAVLKTMQRVHGKVHPETQTVQQTLGRAQQRLSHARRLARAHG